MQPIVEHAKSGIRRYVLLDKVGVPNGLKVLGWELHVHGVAVGEAGYDYGDAGRGLGLDDRFCQCPLLPLTAQLLYPLPDQSEVVPKYQA